MPQYRHIETGELVDAIREGDSYRVIPAGGGFAATIPAKEFDAAFIIAPENNVSLGYVELEDVFDRLPALIPERRWNGWAMPSFAAPEVHTILEWWLEGETAAAIKPAIGEAKIVTKGNIPELVAGDTIYMVQVDDIGHPVEPHELASILLEDVERDIPEYSNVAACQSGPDGILRWPIGDSWIWSVVD